MSTKTNIKYAKQFNKRPGPNQYSLDSEELNWEHCRENFSKKFNESSLGLFFSFLPENENEKRIPSFIEKTEEILIIAAQHNINKSKFFSTNLNFALWVEPSDFWMKCAVRRSLFTLLLRCGPFYNGDYEKALYSVEYCKSTKKAIQRFLYGFTEFDYNGENFEGIGKGWASYFANKDLSIICEKLKQPSHVDKQNFSFGAEILWT